MSWNGFARVFVTAGLVAGLFAATGGAPASAAVAHGRPSRHVVNHRVRVVPAAHPSLRVIKIRHVRVVRTHGVKRRVRTVPWPARGGTHGVVRGAGAGTVQVPPAVAARGGVRPDTGGCGGICEYPVPTSGGGAQGVAVDAKGDAWFAEPSGGKIAEVTPGGSFTEYSVPSEPLWDSLNDLTIGADGNIWFTASNYVGRMTPSGSFTMFPTTENAGVNDIAVASDGNVWFTQTEHQVGYVTPAGQVTEFNIPAYWPVWSWNITAGPGGTVWFDATQLYGGNYVYSITENGTMTQYTVPGVGDITTAGGRLWFPTGGESITAMTPSGSYTTYTWAITVAYGPNDVRSDGAGGVLFTNQYGGAVGDMTSGGAVAFASVLSGNATNGIGLAPDSSIWFSENSGNAMGLIPSSVSLPPSVPTTQTYGCACGTKLSARPEAFRGDPVNTATGAFSQTVTDASLPGPGAAFAFTRAYTSLDTASGPLGPGWTDPYQASLSFDGSGNATFTAGDGQQMAFSYNGSDYTPATGVYATLAAVGGGYQITAPGGSILGFSSSGQLTSVTDHAGTGVTLSYSSGQLATVTDAGGRTVTFTYNGSGLLSSLTMPSGGTVSYGYTSGLLTTVTDPRGGVTTYAYNSAGQLTTITDPDSHTVTANTYDPATGRITSQTNGDGKTTTFTWDPTTQTATTTQPNGGVWTDAYNDNVLLSQTDPDGGITYYGYDSNLDTTSVTDPDGYQTTMTYDSAGNKLSQTSPGPGYYTQSWTYNSLGEVLTATDALGNTTTSTYNSGGLLTSVTDPAGDDTTYTYTGDSQVATLTDPNGHTTTYSYDSHLDLASVTTPGSETTGYGYNADGLRTSVTDPLGKSNSYTYNADGNLTSVTNPDSDDTTYTYDADGHPTAVTDADGHTTTYAYDADGNLTSVTNPLSKTTTYTYDADGNKASAEDPDGNTTSYSYDLDDRLTTTTRPDSSTVSYTYNLDGDRASVTNAAGDTTSYVYTPLGQVTSVTDPLGRLTAYTYDGAGNRVTLTSPDGLVTSYGYDAANRLTAVTYSDGTTHTVGYSYDSDGNRTAMTDATGTSSYTYNSADRLTTVTNGTGDTVSYSYNSDGNITGLTYPDGNTVTRTYDDAQRLAAVTDWNSNTTTFGYDSDGNLTTESYPNGDTATTSYDNADQVTSFTDTNSSATTLASFTYTPGNDGEITSAATTGISEPTHNYTYDSLGELTADNSTSYAYDHASDPTTLAAATQTYDAASELASSVTGSATTTYGNNARGDRVTATISGATTTYGYDAANHLTSYTPPTGDATTYTYDGDGLLASQTTGSDTTTYAWDTTGQLPLMLTSGTTSYIYGPGNLPVESIDSSGTPTYLLHDQLGSTRLLTDSTGTVTGTYTYDPYGNITSHTGTATTTLLYAGQYQDGPTGFYYLRNRYYDPTTGQFLTVDPAVILTQAPYSYANDNPVNITDLAGLCSWYNGYCAVVQPAVQYAAQNPLQATVIVLGAASLVLTAGADAPFVAGGIVAVSAEADTSIVATLADQGITAETTAHGSLAGAGIQTAKDCLSSLDITCGYDFLTLGLGGAATLRWPPTVAVGGFGFLTTVPLPSSSQSDEIKPC